MPTAAPFHVGGVIVRLPASSGGELGAAPKTRGASRIAGRGAGYPAVITSPNSSQVSPYRWKLIVMTRSVALLR